MWSYLTMVALLDFFGTRGTRGQKHMNYVGLWLGDAEHYEMRDLYFYVAEFVLVPTVFLSYASLSLRTVAMYRCTVSLVGGHACLSMICFLQFREGYYVRIIYI